MVLRLSFDNIVNNFIFMSMLSVTRGGKNKNKRKINHFYFYFVLLKVRVGSPVKKIL